MELLINFDTYEGKSISQEQAQVAQSAIRVCWHFVELAHEFWSSQEGDDGPSIAVQEASSELLKRRK